jgi:hypothetical protein
VVVGLGKDEERMLDLMADLIDEIDALWAILLHAEAIEDEIGSEEEWEQRKEGFRVFCVAIVINQTLGCVIGPSVGMGLTSLAGPKQ